MSLSWHSVHLVNELHLSECLLPCSVVKTEEQRFTTTSSLTATKSELDSIAAAHASDVDEISQGLDFFFVFPIFFF